MQNSLRQITYAWVILVTLTVLSMASVHTGVPELAGSGIVLAATVVKGRWMLLDFLKLRHAPSGWRALLLSWLVLIAATSWIAAAIPLLTG